MTTLSDIAGLVASRRARWQGLTVALMVAGYAGCYLCRSNFSVTFNLIVDSLESEGYQRADATVWLGWVASVGTLAYALGKFAAGSLADLLGGRRNVLGGMTGAVLFTLLFAAGGSLPLFSLAWIGNRLVQSTCWAGMVKITGRWFSYSSYGAAMGIVSLSFLFGDAIARWFMGLLLEAGLDWREVFWAAAGGLFALLLLNWLWLCESPRAIGEDEPAANPHNVYAAAGDEQAPLSLTTLLLPLLTSGQFWIVCLLSLGLTLLRETLNFWSPAYFAQTVGSSSGQAAYQSALLPLLGGVSVLLSGWLADRLGRRGRAAVILVGCLVTAGLLLTLSGTRYELGSWMPVWWVTAANFFVLGPYSYLAGAISLDLGGKRGAATACGIIDGVGYLGAFLAGGSIAKLSVHYGWSGAFQFLAVVALSSAVAGAVFFHMQRVVAPVGSEI